ncbi:MAG: DUF6512 family protein [Lachnospiraceae bacterium]
MNKKLIRYMLAGTILVSILGTFMHFVYPWSKNEYWVGFIAPVNESTWEHIKLLFFPTLLYSIFAILNLHKEYPCIESAFWAGILSGTFLIPAIFYTYTGILGFHTLFLDIMTFFLSVTATFIIVYRLTLGCSVKDYRFALRFLLIIMLISFFFFTYAPLKLGLFQIPTMSFITT